MSLNKVMLIGHVGQIEVKTFDGQNGPRKCATFSFATTERYRDRNGEIVNNTEWHNIVSWNHAEFLMDTTSPFLTVREMSFKTSKSPSNTFFI